jgi:hypothetical protein
MKIAAGPRGIEVVHVRVLATGNRAGGDTDHFAVLEYGRAGRNAFNAELVPERNVLPSPDGACGIALQRALIAGTSGVDQRGNVVGGVKNDTPWHG